MCRASYGQPARDRQHSSQVDAAAEHVRFVRLRTAAVAGGVCRAACGRRVALRRHASTRTATPAQRRTHGGAGHRTGTPRPAAAQGIAACQGCVQQALGILASAELSHNYTADKWPAAVQLEGCGDTTMGRARRLFGRTRGDGVCPHDHRAVPGGVVVVLAARP